MPRILETTPRADGFRMPAEWEPHAGCWMLWPERSDNWRNGAKPAQRAFAALADGGTVTMPLSPTFWAKTFGMLTDRHGVSWAINGEPIALG